MERGAEVIKVSQGVNNYVFDDLGKAQTFAENLLLHQVTDKLYRNDEVTVEYVDDVTGLDVSISYMMPVKVSADDVQ